MESDENDTPLPQYSGTTLSASPKGCSRKLSELCESNAVKRNVRLTALDIFLEKRVSKLHNAVDQNVQLAASNERNKTRDVASNPIRKQNVNGSDGMTNPVNFDSSGGSDQSTNTPECTVKTTKSKRPLSELSTYMSGEGKVKRRGRGPAINTILQQKGFLASHNITHDYIGAHGIAASEVAKKNIPQERMPLQDTTNNLMSNRNVNERSIIRDPFRTPSTGTKSIPENRESFVTASHCRVYSSNYGNDQRSDFNGTPVSCLSDSQNQISAHFKNHDKGKGTATGERSQNSTHYQRNIYLHGQVYPNYSKPGASTVEETRGRNSKDVPTIVKENFVLTDNKRETSRSNKAADTVQDNQYSAHNNRQGNAVPSTSRARNLYDSFNEADEEDQYFEDDFQESYMDIVENPTIDTWEGYLNLGPPQSVCTLCGSVMWNMERNNKSNKNAPPTFSLCCKNGQVKLPKERQAPEPLATLIRSSKHFRLLIRVYNALFAMCSSGGRVDRTINRGRAPYCFKIRGQNMHFIGSLLPEDGDNPKYCQLYIYDTENELSNRMNAIGEIRDRIDQNIVEALMRMFREHNKVVKQFLTARERFKNQPLDEFNLVLISSEAASGRQNIIGPSNEVGGFIVNSDPDKPGFRDTVVHRRDDKLQRVWETDLFFMQLQYPVLFPLGDDGFHTKIPLKKINSRCKPVVEIETEEQERKNREFVTMKEYYCYKLMIRLSEGLTPHLGGRLWQQYVVDAFTAIEQYRLDWISRNQTIIRSDLYTSVRDAIRRGDNDPDHVGKCTILPATFTGSKRYMAQYFKDSLALCRVIGHPTLFLTMTCNSKWPEIQEMMKHLPGVDVCDAPDIVSRVFKLKLDQLIDLIKNKNYFGKCIGIMHVIEFQKRGLPHCHMLIWLDPKSRPQNIDQIDSLVSAEIPDKENDPIGYAAVKNYMMHGPCGQDWSYSPCMVKGKCTRHFPKRYNSNTCFDDCGFPVYRRRRTSARVTVKGKELDNQYVVPFNRDLLVKFQCHINLEICNNSRSLKYLFKYCLKGHDNATMMLQKKKGTFSASQPRNSGKSLNEVQHYLDGRYVCASEAAWRIFGFDIHSRWPSVDRLPIHLPGHKYVSFKTGECLQKVFDRATTRRSKLEAWFLANKEMPRARDFTYSEFPSHFTWKPRECKWKERQRGDVVGRLSEVHATAGDLLYLRMLLLRRKGCLSFEEIRTVGGHLYDSYKEACGALGLLEDDSQWHEAILENSQSSFPHQLREMFVNILAYCSVSNPNALWHEHWRCMSDDIEHNRRLTTGNNNLRLSESDIQNYALAEIEKLLNDVGKSLKDYPTMPFPPDIFRCADLNRLIIEETSYDKSEMKEQHDINYHKLNVEQKKAYHSVVDSIEADKGGLFFVYGSGGCGKTFLWQTICCRLRSENKIVLPVASSGIAATLLPGGRTAHSRFHIPLKLDQHSTAGIKHGTDIAELLQHTSLIIWDEAPMQHRHAFECVDRTLRDIMSAIDPARSQKPFGGITVVFGGDFRQILPVITKATRAEVVGASLNASKLWDDCQVIVLTKNMRLHSGNTAEQNKVIMNFSDWQLKVGDGKLDTSIRADNRSPAVIQVPEEFVVRCQDKPIQTLCDIVYPDFVKNMSSHAYMRSRAILTPTNAVVDDVNSMILGNIPDTTHTYLSQDSIEDAGVEENDFDDSFPVEYLNSLNMPCLPKHELKIKNGVTVMLMRNLNQILGLCNGTRMVVTGCKKNSIECQILTGSHVGRKHLIPRIDMVPTDTKWPFEFKRTQFPLQLCFAMTVNKSQGQSLDTVGLYLPKSVFGHGQMYVAVSRVTSPRGLHILIDSDTGESTNITENVVYEEVFYNLPTLDD